jgi:hypothetical protein
MNGIFKRNSNLQFSKLSRWSEVPPGMRSILRGISPHKVSDFKLEAKRTILAGGKVNLVDFRGVLGRTIAKVAIASV